MIKMVLFDWNGTLLDDIPEWFEVVKTLFKKFGLEAPSVAQFFRGLEELEGDYLSVYKKYGLSMSREESAKIYGPLYESSMAQLKLSPNVIPTIEKLSKRISLLGIITGQLENLVTPLLKKFGILSYFPILKFHVMDKSACINGLLNEYNLHPAECLYVGDAPSDIRHAQKSGIRSVAFINPYIPLDLILAPKPDYLIKDFSQLLKINQDC